MTIDSTTGPTLRAGTWSIDPVHSAVSFTVRHLGVTTVRGTFDDLEGTIRTAEELRRSSTVVTIRTTSVNTRNDQRDAHLRSADFLDVRTHPTMTFRSTAIRPRDAGSVFVDGDLTLRDVTRSVTLVVEIGGVADAPHGATVIGFSATTEISRSDFGVTGGPAGGLVGDRIKIGLEIEAVLSTDPVAPHA